MATYTPEDLARLRIRLDIQVLSVRDDDGDPVELALYAAGYLVGRSARSGRSERFRAGALPPA